MRIKGAQTFSSLCAREKKLDLFLIDQSFCVLNVVKQNTRANFRRLNRPMGDVLSGLYLLQETETQQT